MRAIVVFSCLTVALCLFFYVNGPAMGHSFILNIAWDRHFTEQVLAGDLYPRWLYGHNQGAGSPVFFFYGPFPFWVSAIGRSLLCPGCSLEKAHMIGPSVLLGLSGVSFYLWARMHAAPPAALLAAVCYVFLPYHFAVDLWHRSALGELAAYVWMPLVLLGLARGPRHAGYTLLAASAYAGVILSHVPSALLFSPVMALFAVAWHGIRRGLLSLVVPVALGGGLAAVYLVPALATQHYINPAAWWGNGHYDPVNWLWLDGRAAPHRFEHVVLAALLVGSVLALASLVALVRAGRTGHAVVIFCVLSLGYAWLLMTYPSILLWEHLGLLRKVQFPWRTGIVVDLATATLLALALDQALTRRRAFNAAAALAATVLVAYYAYNADNLRGRLLLIKTEDRIEAMRSVIRRGTDPFEYRTAWSLSPDAPQDYDTLIQRLRAEPEVGVVSGEARLNTLRRRIDRTVVDVEATRPSVLRFRRFYYPGWTLTAEAGTGPALTLAPSEPLGLIEARVPQGHHRLVLARRPLREERLGALVSLLALIGCCFVALAGPALRFAGFTGLPMRRP